MRTIASTMLVELKTQDIKHSMLNTIASVLLPVFFVIALGYAAGCAKRFDSEQVQGLNLIVLRYALPASLFVGTARTPRDQILQQGSFFLALLIALAGFYLIIYLLNLRLYHRDWGTTAVQTLMTTSPTAAFMGTGILGGLSGPSSSVSIAITAIIINLIQAPLTIILLETSHSQKNQQKSLGKTIWTSLLNAAQAPVIWFPVLGILLVLASVKVPDLINKMLNLIGTSSSGLALFFTGLTIAAHRLKLNREVMMNSALKMIVQPLLMFVFILWFGIRNPAALDGIVICALASGVIGVILASRYRTYESEASSTLLLTAMLMIVTLPIAIAVADRF